MSSIVEIPSDNDTGNDSIPKSQGVEGSQSVGVEGSASRVEGSANRKRQRPSAQSPEANSKKRKTPAKLVWTAEKTAVIMGFFIDCHRNGLFKSSKRANFLPAWERVLANAVERWPSWKSLLSVKSISNKYDTERRRYIAWKGWVDKSGHTCNPGTGACEIDRESASWQSYLNQHGSRRVAWLGAGQALGPVDLYHELFSKEKVKGDFIAGPAGDDDFEDELSLRAGRYSFDESRATTPRGGQSEVDSEGESLWLPTAPLTLPPAPRGSGLTSSQAHRRATDPDITAARERAADVRRGKRVDRGVGSGEGGSGEGGSGEGGSGEGGSGEGSLGEGLPPSPALPEDRMADAIGSLVATLEQEIKQGNPVKQAVTLFSQTYRERFPPGEYVRILRGLKNQDEAEVWLALDAEGREIYMAELIKGPGSGSQ